MALSLALADKATLRVDEHKTDTLIALSQKKVLEAVVRLDYLLNLKEKDLITMKKIQVD